MIKTVFFLSTLLVLFTACNKADTPASSEDMIRGGQWKRSSLKFNLHNPDGSTTTTDGYVLLPECVKDNTLEFKVNYVGTETKNAKCSAGDPDANEFNWEIYNSGKNIRIYNADETFSTNSVNGEILSLSANLLSFRYNFVQKDPINQTSDTVTVEDVFKK